MRQAALPFPGNLFRLADDADPTRLAAFDLSGLSAGTTRTFTLPNLSATLAHLGNAAQTFSGATTFSNAAVTIGTATTTAAYGIGTGGTTTAVTKTINLGTGGAAGSTTVINLGSTTAGALGSTIINTPTVTFASSVTAIGAAAANVTALGLGLGGASPDASNRLSVNAAATLLNNAGGSHEATINKAAAGNDASLALKTGFSARALFGLLGTDDVTLKVSPNGSTFFDAFVIDRATGRAEFPAPIVIPGLSAVPASPSAGRLALYGRQRAGAPWLEVVRPSGRDFPLQPHMGLNRIGAWAPVSATTIAAQGIALTSVGTVSHPRLGGRVAPVQFPALASDLGRRGGFRLRSALGRHSCRPDQPDHPASDRNGLLRLAILNRSPRCDHSAFRARGSDRPRVSTRHAYELATGQQ